MVFTLFFCNILLAKQALLFSTYYQIESYSVVEISTDYNGELGNMARSQLLGLCFSHIMLC